MGESRAQSWLEASLLLIWDRFFSDIPVVNQVTIAYCRPSKTRLGWIALSESGRCTQIGINRLLGYTEVPEEVSVITIAHELVHYAHGFGSPHPRRYADPHAGGIVERELVHRGLSEQLRRYQDWSAHVWGSLYERYAAGRTRSRPRLAGFETMALDGRASGTLAALDVSPDAIAIPFGQ